MSQIMSMGTKTEMCMAFTEGLCTKGDQCVYAHNLRELAPGGYKPRLCPSFMRGGCPRMGSCLYAHKKEELPPNFKCIQCRNYTSGFCRKQQICTLAHGEEEQTWFIQYMGVPENTGSPASMVMQGGGKGNASHPRVPPHMQGMGNQNQGGGMPALADNVMSAAENQLQQGVNIQGQLALGDVGGPARPKMQPHFQPKINLANNP